ncbi:FAD:protein FMN transferase [Lutimonas halocynthiae]|uniref:FAD:protein FMN transferase n=1 Tax=Lutimonas halocynthiae TaxID=1446477 RepID=UPI0025B31D6E|nr:FAD:protein FMN transferase [Lutimonas halocynthiae]MDN3642682.1 FAD:protein FMN transferase [Lutimonas halocynthiae]
MKKVFIIILIFLVYSCEKKSQKVYQQLEGLAFGTSFHITMDDGENQISEADIDSLIHAMNRSLSTYIPNSDISRINNGDTTVIVDELFKEVFEKSARIYKESEGAFDPTIGTLVNAWGFGPADRIENMEQKDIDSLLVFVGFQKLKLENSKLIKMYPEMFLDFNANAKGYAVDVIGRFLEQKGVVNYLVEIGGEIRARGKNAKRQIWRVAIEKPNFDGSRSFQTIIVLNNEAIATSGNYRKFKIDTSTGEKYAHTIDTKTGYPSKSNLLSASVIGDIDCADVDAYATAFMAMGLEKTKAFLDHHKDLKAFLIYGDENGDLQTYTTSNLNLEEN